MKIIIKEKDIEIVGKFVKGKAAAQFKNKWKLSPKNGKCKIDISGFEDKALQKLHDHLGKLADAGDRSANLSKRMVKQWQEIKQNPDSQKAPKMESIPSIMGAYISTGEHRYIFEQCPDGNMVPWFVDNVIYHSPDARHGVSARVSVSLSGINTGSSSRDGNGNSFNIDVDGWRGMTMSEILNKKGYYLETPERIKSYDEEVNKFLLHCNEDGFQMNVTGKCCQMKGWYNNSFRPVEKSGAPAKMVVDPDDKEWEESSVECKFWEGNMSGDDDDFYDDDEDLSAEAQKKLEEEGPALWQLPVHPILRMFDLDEHGHYRVHVNNAVDYEYDLKVGEKLVLPKDVKDFIEVLIEHSKNSFVDIISGKEGGTVILLEGPPGTGKTLSAEVYSEIMQRPLYKVQSSQLGTEPDDLETHLKEVLERAERWGAILLIDEADVYVYERGADIIQNAIVGVFLRVLEYYRGVLFMTTNRGTMVDDAIVSRLTARFRYQKPSVDEQNQLWNILANANGVELPEGEVGRIIEALPGLSGRDIKNLLKLAHVMSLKRKCPVDTKLLKFVAQFKQMKESEEK